MEGGVGRKTSRRRKRREIKHSGYAVSDALGADIVARGIAYGRFQVPTRRSRPKLMNRAREFSLLLASAGCAPII